MSVIKQELLEFYTRFRTNFIIENACLSRHPLSKGEVHVLSPAVARVGLSMPKLEILNAFSTFRIEARREIRIF